MKFLALAAAILLGGSSSVNSTVTVTGYYIMIDVGDGPVPLYRAYGYMNAGLVSANGYIADTGGALSGTTAIKGANIAGVVFDVGGNFSVYVDSTSVPNSFLTGAIVTTSGGVRTFLRFTSATTIGSYKYFSASSAVAWSAPDGAPTNNSYSVQIQY